MDELTDKINYGWEFRQSDLICFTETRLNEDSSDTVLSGYTIIREDRDEMKLIFAIGGRLCVYMDDKWAANLCICEQFGAPKLLLCCFIHHPPRPNDCFHLTTLILFPFILELWSNHFSW